MNEFYKAWQYLSGHKIFEDDYTNKYPYDMAAIYLFFERGRKQKLVCHINGENRIL